MILGIDYDSYKATICALPFSGGKPEIEVADFRPARASGEDAGIAALAAVHDSLGKALGRFDDLRFYDAAEGHLVWIERGFGMSRRADFILGAYFGAIWAALDPGRILRRDLDRVNPMDLREWKKIVTKAAGIGLTKKGDGNGNAKKEVANEAARALLELVEIDGSSWTPDALDAFGIAYAGRKLNASALSA